MSAGLAEVRAAMPRARIEGFAGDLSATDAAEALKRKAPAVDILVNNLGIFEPKPFEEIPDDRATERVDRSPGSVEGSTGRVD